MKRLIERRPRFRIGRVLASIAAAMLCVTVLSQPNPAYAGGFHGGGGGFHGGGFHGGGFHGGGFHDNRVFFGGGFGFPWLGYYQYYDYSQPYASETWYYCSDPAGYYPNVMQCNTGWQAIPAS